MLVAAAIGDCYGFGFRYASPSFIQKNNTCDQYLPSERFPNLWEYHRYSHAAQMMVATASAIISKVPWTQENLAKKMLEFNARDFRVSDMFRNIHADTAKSLLRQVKPNNIDALAAVRAVPIGLFPEDEIKDRCLEQATITHCTKEGTEAALGAAFMSHFLHRKKGKKDELPTYLCEHVHYPWRMTWTGVIGTKGTDAVHAAVNAIVLWGSMKEILYDCVKCGGETNLTCAIAMACSAGNEQIKQNLSERFLDDLERDKDYGVKFLTEMEVKLMRAFQ